jgi:redox-sensitive bicupin YhaK (pirin superfamily)
MITIRKSKDRGAFDHGWLKSFHTFSFASYHDPAHVHFRDLRVINQDQIAPGMGFGTHPHDNMEIISFVISGELAHRDSMGHEEVIRAGEVQVMSAGSGITHSEYNASKMEWTELLQIWVFPNEKNVEPRYAQKPFSAIKNGLRLLVSSDGRDESLWVHQDISVFLGSGTCTFEIAEGRGVWIQVISGEMAVNDVSVSAGDGLSVSHETLLAMETTGNTEFLLFDLK